MSRKVILMVLVVFLLLGMAEKCFASDSPESLYDTARERIQSKKYEEAKSLYQQIIQQYPSSPYVSKAQMGIAEVDILTDINAVKISEAKAGINSLTANFSEDPNLPEILYDITKRYRWTWNYEEAKSLCQQIIQQYPSSPYASKAQMCIAEIDIVSDIKAGKMNEAQSGVNSLIANFSGHPDLPKTLYFIGRQYRWSRKYEKAKSLYQQIIQRYPNASYASKAQMGIAEIDIVSDIRAEKMNEAQSGVNSLIANFSGHPDLPKALYYFGRKCRWSKKFEEAKDFYQRALQQYPDSSYAGQARRGIAEIDILSDINAGKISEAKAGVNNLIAGFSKDSDFARILYYIGRRYGATGNHEDARSIYQQITQLYPSSPYARRSQMIIAKTDIISLITSRNDGGVMAAIDSLIASHSSDSELSIAVYQIAKQYSGQALQAENEGLVSLAQDYSQKAATLWERAIDELPVTLATPPDAGCIAGDCYYELGEYEKSIGCYQKVVDGYPSFQYVWHALHMVGLNYEKMQEAGRISKPEAEPMIKAAYEQLLEKYPDCPRAEYVRNWLNQHSSK